MVRFKGKDQIEFGHKYYDEAGYGGSPGATPTTLYRIGYVTELRPSLDPELNRVFVLRDGGSEGRPVGVFSRRANVKLGIRWLQGQLGDYFQKYVLGGYNFFAEAKMYRDASNQLYLFWAGLKADVLAVQCSIGEPVVWSAEMVGKLYDSKVSTIHSYGASPGAVWEWSDCYVQVSTNGSDWTTIPDVTDWEFRVDNQLKPNFVFNSAGSKQLSSLEEMERLCDARLTMNLQDGAYLDYLVDQTELYLKLALPNSKYLQFSKGVRIDPARKRREYIGRLERVMRMCDRMVADPGGYEELQVKAMVVLIRAVRVCYGIVGDVEVGQLEQEVEELKAREAELGGGPGYFIEDPSG